MRIAGCIGKGLMVLFCLIAAQLELNAAPIAADLSAIRPGPIAVTATDGELSVVWTDGLKHQWRAIFSLDSKLPLITSISSNGNAIIEKAVPYYRCSTGIRLPERHIVRTSLIARTWKTSAARK